MKLIVTGSIAFDYLMSFPGKFTEHLLPEHMHRLSLSFLVDTMDKRRGGCAPNIAYTLALLGERPLLLATAGLNVFVTDTIPVMRCSLVRTETAGFAMRVTNT